MSKPRMRKKRWKKQKKLVLKPQRRVKKRELKLKLPCKKLLQLLRNLISI